MVDSLLKDTSVAVKRGIDSSRWFAYGTDVIGWSGDAPVKATFVLCCCPSVTKSNPLFPEFSFKTGGNFIIGSAYRIRTGDLLLEREVS